MAFSFGAPAAPKPAASTFSFGAPSTSTPSLFGSAPAPASSAPSLFGSTPAPATSTPGTSLFGNTSAPAPSGGLFGSTPAAGGAGSSLFGGGATAAKPASNSLFGAAPGQTCTPATYPPATSSLFGTAQTQAPATGSLFGQPAGSSSSLFGQQQQPQQQQQQQQPAVTSAPLFGQSQSAATASLFGSKPASSAPQPTTTSLSLFGSSTTANGGAAQLSQFGQQQPLSQQQQLSASQAQAGAAAPRKLGDPVPPNPHERTIESRIELVKASYDPGNPKCRFQTYFYNEPGVGQRVEQFQRPPNATDERAWLKAVKENPDPDHLVPALAIGFQAIEKRIQHQSLQTQAHQNLLSDLSSHLSQLGQKHSLETSLRSLRAQQTCLQLVARLTQLVAKSSAIAPGRNQSLKREEEELRIGLEGNLRNEVERLRNKSLELWTGVGQLRSRKKLEADQGLEWHVADEQGFNQILEVLTSQQRGLDHLTRTLERMTVDTDVINEAFGRPLLLSSRTAGVEAGLSGNPSSSLSSSVAQR